MSLDFECSTRIAATPPAAKAEDEAKSGESSAGKAGDKFWNGGGEMGERMRGFNWSQTPLGPHENWPQSLKTSVSLMLNSQHPMWIGWGPEATFLYNDAYLHVLGLAKHPWALGRPAAEVWAEIWDVCGPLADKVFARGEATFVDDVRLFMRRGPDFLEETFYSFSYSPIRDESGAVAGLFCPSSDVTAKNIGARRLATLSELAAKALVEKTTVQACATAAAILARNSDDVPFALLYLIEPEDRRAKLEQSIRVLKGSDLAPELISLDARGEREPWPVKRVASRTEAEVVDTRGLAFPFQGTAGQRIAEAVVLPVAAPGHNRPFGVLVAGVNPTRKLDAEYQTFFTLVAGQIATAVANARASEEDRKRAEALAELDRAKTTFFSNISHELRTPLTLMLGPLEDELGANPSARPALELVHRNSLRLLKLVNTLLDFSRIEAGRIQANYEPTDLASYTAELASVFRSAAEKAGLRLAVDCPSLPEPVYVDREMWEKIVFNLVSNALKFTFEGEIRVSLRWDGEHVALEVADSGVGIPEAELSRLFERFHRVRGTRSRTHEGTGIGLAFVQELVKLHGGHVKVQSREGQGTKFTVCIRTGAAHLPKERIGGVQASRQRSETNPFLEEALRWLPESAGEPKVEESLDAANSFADEASEQAREKPEVLLADDNTDMRQYVQRLLSKDYRVTAVADGEAALEAIARQKPQLVLTDVMMPRMNGFELLARLRSRPDTRTLPVIMLSARAGEEARMEGLGAGADDYLIKPFSSRELLARVSSQLQMSRLRQEGEERVTRILESITDGFQVLDGEWRMTFMNAAAQRMVAAAGLVPEQMLGKHFWEEIFPAARGTLLEAQFGRAMNERVTVEFENYYEPWGRWYWVRAFPVQEGGISIFFQDITDAKRADETQARLAAIVEYSHDAIISKDLNGIITSWNKGAQSVFGYTAEEAIGKPITLLIPEERQHEEPLILEKLRKGIPIEHFETIRRHRDGSLLDISLTISPIRDVRGQVVGVSKIARDITHRKRTEEALRASEKQLRQLAESMPQLVWSANVEGVVDYYNNQISKYSGGRHVPPGTWEWRGMLHPDDLQRTEDQWAKAVASQSDYEMEHRLRLADGSYRWHLSRAYPGRDAEGRLVKWFGTATDIDDQKRAREILEQKVVERTAKLQEALAELEGYSYSIAHDMRAPLRSMQAFSQLLVEDYGGQLPAEARQFLGRIVASAARLDRLIQDVLSYSKFISGEVPLELVDTLALVRDIIESYPQFQNERLRIVVEPDLPAVKANRAALTQVFSNLLGNAIKFVAPGVQPQVHVRAEPNADAGRVRFWIEDNGIGIEAPAQKRIFNLFQRLNHPTQYEGTGLGLAIVRKSLERMGGSVGVESEPGLGSRFWFDLSTG